MRYCQEWSFYLVYIYNSFIFNSFLPFFISFDIDLCVYKV